MKTKVCNVCDEEKSHTEFYGRKQSIDGLAYTCKTCSKNRAKISKQQKRAIETKPKEVKKPDPPEVKKSRKPRYLVNREEYFTRFINEVKLRGGTCDINIDDYKGAQVKLPVNCSSHGQFEITPNNLHKGRWCKKCNYQNRPSMSVETKEKIKISNQITHAKKRAEKKQGKRKKQSVTA